MEIIWKFSFWVLQLICAFITVELGEHASNAASNNNMKKENFFTFMWEVLNGLYSFV